MKRFTILILSLFLIQNLYSQEKKALSIEDCIKIGIENSKTLSVSASKIDFAKAKSSEIDAGMLPSLKLNAGYSRLSNIPPAAITFMGYTFVIAPTFLDNYSTRLSLQQTLFAGNRLTSNSDIMEMQAKASVEDFNKDKSQLLLDIKNAYWSLYKAIMLRKSVDENITQMKSHLTDIENMFKNGMTTNNEVLKVKVQLSNVELLKIDADNGVQISMMALNNTIGLPILTQIEPTSTIETQNYTLPDLNKTIETAYNKRPEVKSMEYRIKAGEYGVSMAKSGWYPQISASANYYYNKPNQRIFNPPDQFKGTWDIGLNLSMDLWNWMTTKHQTSEAQATLEQSKIGLSQFKDAVILEITQNYLNLVKAKEKIDASDESVKQSEENFRVTEQKFKAGMSINTDLLDAELLLLQAKLNYASAIVDYELAIAKLEKSIGI
jgi:outer membrane protein TolC